MDKCHRTVGPGSIRTNRRGNGRREAGENRAAPVGYFLFSGEQHGFREADTIKRCLDAERAFYAIEVFKIGLRF